MKKGTNQSQHSALSTQHSRSTQHFPPPRRGTVLLIVVVLLLMLAILGVSYLGSTRVDRLASGQEVANAQIDQITDSVRDIAVSNIVNGLFASNGNGYQYRGASNNSTAPYNNFDIPVYNYNNTGDAWLADRVPVEVPSTQVVGVASPPGAVGANAPAWGAITEPLIAQALPSTASAAFVSGGGAFEFEDPTVNSSAAGNTFGNQYNPYLGGVAGAINPALPVYPWYKTVNTVGGTISHPAIYLQSGAGPIVAGDADGDGIADCGLMRLPGSYADGLTYYAGVRIIDNNSAINVNTALDNGNDAALPISGTTSTTSFLYGFFPANVGLVELLSKPPANGNLTEVPNITNYQVNYNGTPASLPNGNIILDDGSTMVAVKSWSSVGDLLAAQLAHRMGNPGYVLPGQRGQPVPPTDQVNLAFHGGLFASPKTFSTSGAASFPQSVLDGLLLNSEFAFAANINNQPIASGGSGLGSTQVTSYPAPPAGSSNAANAVVVTNWFNYNFAYLTPAPNAAMIPVNNPRPLLVAANPIANAVPVVDPDAPNQGLGNAAMLPYKNLGRLQVNITYYPGDVVWWGNSFYVCKSQNLNAANPANTQTPPSATNWVQPLAKPYFVGGSYNVGDVVAYTANINAPSDNNSTSVNLGTNYAYSNYNGTVNTATTAAPVRFYLSLANSNITNPTASVSPPVWQLLDPPPGRTPGKTSVNTAGFSELFRAYWSAMVEGNDPTSTPFGNEAVASGNTFGAPSGPYLTSILGNGTYWGSQFSDGPSSIYVYPNSGPVVSTPIAPGLFSSTPNQYHRQRMFRSSLRDPRTPPVGTVPYGLYFPPPQQMLLRAALAAVNTENLRSPLTNNTAKISLTAVLDGASRQVNVNVYGIQQQPYITEVYCNTDTSGGSGNTAPYVAIKLYNPNRTAIPLSNWELIYVMRPSTAVVNGQSAYNYAGTAGAVTGLYYNTVAVPQPTFPIASIPAPLAATPLSGVTIPGGPAGGYCLIDNFNGVTVKYRPTETGLDGNSPPQVTDANGALPKALPGNFVYKSVAGLENVVTANGAELVLLKYPTPPVVPTSLMDYTPVDSFDFTGINSGGAATAWHYARGDAVGPTASEYVYPGRYDGSQLSRRHQGIQAAQWIPPQTDPWDPVLNPVGGAPPTNFPAPPAVGVPPYFEFGAPTDISTFPNPRQIRIAQDDWPSPAGATSFPYSQFARNGDILMVPYFGAYTVVDATVGTPLEFNSVSMDAAFADDSVDPSDTHYDKTTQLGRFCPTQNDLITYTGVAAATGAMNPLLAGGNTITDTLLQSPSGSYYAGNSNFSAGTDWTGWDVLVTQIQSAPGGTLTSTSQIRHVTAWSAATHQLTLDAPILDPSNNAPVATNRAVTYSLIRPNSWATHLLDYLTVYSPRDDYLPNVDPSAAANLNIQPVANNNSAASPSNSTAEETVGTEGLINVNTAPWRVLAALPLVIGPGSVVDAHSSALLAQQIVADREQYGPFKSLFDLNRVYDPLDPLTAQDLRRGFRNGWGTMNSGLGFNGSAAGSAGNIAVPAAGPASSIPNQFDETYLQVARLSNLLTTRSDTFTVYIVIEGWQNAGTANAKLALTRRAAYIVDRNSVTPTSRAVRIIDVPNN